MAKGKLFIMFWSIDEDTGSPKDGSPWFNSDTDREAMNKWLDSHPGDFWEMRKYVYDRRKK